MLVPPFTLAGKELGPVAPIILECTHALDAIALAIERHPRSSNGKATAALAALATPIWRRLWHCGMAAR